MHIHTDIPPSAGNAVSSSTFVLLETQQSCAVPFQGQQDLSVKLKDKSLIHGLRNQSVCGGLLPPRLRLLIWGLQMNMIKSEHIENGAVTT